MTCNKLNRSDNQKLDDLQQLGSLSKQLHQCPSNDLQSLLNYLLNPNQNITVIYVTSNHLLNNVTTHPYSKSGKIRL